MIAPERVCWESPSICLARPKSVILGWWSGVSRTFAGFRSRWMIPRAWASAIARHRAITIVAATRGACGLPLMNWERLPPGTNSREKYGRPSRSPSSWIWTIPGCWIRATARASMWNRAIWSSEAWAPARIIFRATRRSSRMCRAL